MKKKLIFVVLTYVMVRVLVFCGTFVAPSPLQEYLIDKSCRETVTFFYRLVDEYSLQVPEEFRRCSIDSVMRYDRMRYFFSVASKENIVFTVRVDSMNATQTKCGLIYIELINPQDGSVIIGGDMTELPIHNVLQGIKAFEKNILAENFKWEKPHPFPLFDAVIYSLNRNMSAVTYCFMAIVLLLISIMIYRCIREARSGS